jgi:hypothetical protein
VRFIVASAWLGAATQWGIDAAELIDAANVQKQRDAALMRSHEEKKDRGRPPPDISWRRLVRLDADGLVLIGVFFGTLLVLAVLFALASYNAHA